MRAPNVLDALPVAGTLADANSSAGAYPITLLVAAPATYELTLVPGTLTVTKATVVATADPQSRALWSSQPDAEHQLQARFINGQDSAGWTRCDG